MRSTREPANSGVYHAIIRGVDRLDIFEDDQDRHVFLKRIREYMDDTGVRIVAYCLMTNHVHMVIDARNGDLSAFMHKLCTSYSEYFNSKYDRSGHLFQGRFISEPIETSEYFMVCVRYVLYNPQNGGICKYDEYQWSSYADYFGREGLTDGRLIYQVFNGRDDFVHFLKAGCVDKCLEYSKSRCRTDEEARELAKAEFGLDDLSKLKDVARADRDDAIARMRGMGMSIERISRLTGISHGSIQRVEAVES